MKKTIKKIFASILTIALIASVCTMVPVMANGEEQPTEMEFVKEGYQAWLTSYPSIITTSETGVELRAASFDTSRLTRIAYFGTVTEAPKAYNFLSEGAYVQIKIPKKENYDIKTVAVTVTKKSSAQEYEKLFDYEYSTDDGVTWIKEANSTYTKKYMASTHTQNNNAFVEVIKVPENATDLKVIRNASKISMNASQYGVTGVLGVQFGYMPSEMGDVLQFSADCDTEMIDLFSSGIIADDVCYWDPFEYDYDGDGINEAGFVPSRSKTITINAVEGYKITSVSGVSWLNSTGGKSGYVELGDKTFKTTGTQGATPFTLTYEDGADTLVFANTSQYTGLNFYDLNITMEKIAEDEELAMSVSSAVRGEEQVDVSVQTSGIATAEYATMKLIVAGYDGDTMTGVDVITVEKANPSDTYPAVLPTTTTKVKAFLWKDLTTITPVIIATPEFTVTTN